MYGSLACYTHCNEHAVIEDRILCTEGNDSHREVTLMISRERGRLHPYTAPNTVVIDLRFDTRGVILVWSPVLTMDVWVMESHAFFLTFELSLDKQSLIYTMIY